MPKKSILDRRRFLGTTATTIAAAQLGMLARAQAGTSSTEGTSTVTTVAQETGRGASPVRPFPRVNFPQPQLADLRHRVKATQWPTKELVTDDTQGVQLAMIQALAGYWASDYDWHAFEARLSACARARAHVMRFTL
jgi:hypothetical protein